jgi:hypothetical protein
MTSAYFKDIADLHEFMRQYLVPVNLSLQMTIIIREAPAGGYTLFMSSAGTPISSKETAE